MPTRLRRFALRGLLFIGAACLGACQLAPRHERPAWPAPQEWSEDEGRVQDGVRAPSIDWREFFVDPRLTALLGVALEHNRDLAVAAARIEEARGLFRIQRSARLPNVDVRASATRGRRSAEAVGVQTPLPAAGDGDYEIFSLGAVVSAFELDFWGRVRNLSASARSQYLASVEAAQAFRLSLIREVAFAYLASLEADERIQLAAATVRSRNDGLRIAKRRLDAGVTSALDFRQAETLLTQAQIELAALQLASARSRNLLAALLGGAIDDALPAPLPLAAQSNMQALATGLPSELLTMRPDILAAEARLRTARADIGAARAAFFPSISLTGDYGYSSTALDDLVGENSRTWSYGPVIDLPIFDFGRRRGNLAVAEARENIAIAEYERAIQSAFREVADALAGRRFLAEQVSAQERSTLAQRHLADLARTRYREGVVSYIEVLDAERTLFAAEQALLQVRRAEVENLVTLYVALGGGVEATP